MLVVGFHLHTSYHVTLFVYGMIFHYSNEKEGTALSSAAEAGKDRIVGYLLNIGASANGSMERYNLRVIMISSCNVCMYHDMCRVHHYCWLQKMDTGK